MMSCDIYNSVGISYKNHLIYRKIDIRYDTSHRKLRYCTSTLYVEHRLRGGVFDGCTPTSTFHFLADVQVFLVVLGMIFVVWCWISHMVLYRNVNVRYMEISRVFHGIFPGFDIIPWSREEREIPLPHKRSRSRFLPKMFTFDMIKWFFWQNVANFYIGISYRKFRYVLGSIASVEAFGRGRRQLHPQLSRGREGIQCPIPYASIMLVLC